MFTYIERSSMAKLFTYELIVFLYCKKQHCLIMVNLYWMKQNDLIFNLCCKNQYGLNVYLYCTNQDGVIVYIYCNNQYRLIVFIYWWYHLFRRCFRCRVCGLQLSLRTFHFDQENDPDVYCKNHVPKFVGTIDGEALNVRTALNAPKVTKTKEVKGQIISKKEVFKLMRSYLIYLWKVCSLLVHWRNKL